MTGPVWRPSPDLFPDLAPLIACAMVESYAGPTSPEALVMWALENWPRATNEQAVRAVQIALELMIVDHLCGIAG